MTRVVDIGEGSGEAESTHGPGHAARLARGTDVAVGPAGAPDAELRGEAPAPATGALDGGDELGEVARVDCLARPPDGLLYVLVAVAEVGAQLRRELNIVGVRIGPVPDPRTGALGHEREALVGALEFGGVTLAVVHVHERAGGLQAFGRPVRLRRGPTDELPAVRRVVDGHADLDLEGTRGMRHGGQGGGEGFAVVGVDPRVPGGPVRLVLDPGGRLCGGPR